MKRYHAIIYKAGKELVPSAAVGLIGFAPPQTTSYETLVDCILDQSWNADGSPLRRLILKIAGDGTLRPFRLETASKTPGASTWWTLDSSDEDGDYAFGKHRTAEENARIEAAYAEQTQRYEAWNRPEHRRAREFNGGLL